MEKTSKKGFYLIISFIGFLLSLLFFISIQLDWEFVFIFVSWISFGAIGLTSFFYIIYYFYSKKFKLY